MIKNPPASAGDTRDGGLIAGLGTLPGLRRKQQPTLVFLPEKSHGQRSLVGHTPWGRKGSDTTEPLKHTHTPYIRFLISGLRKVEMSPKKLTKV